jgi:hypothetical protein
MRQKSARQAIAEALIHHGCDTEFASKKARVAYDDIKENVQVDAEYEVSVVDGEKTVSVRDYIGAYLKTSGRWLLPPKSPPSDKGSARGSRVEDTEKIDLSMDDYSRGRYDKNKMKAGGYNMPVIGG